ncbi:unnamed protein product (macronuclear) [Paramecium tetraurelia]|uniref:RAP domain-containing protein n=1 Tax=Paramecium tetraurelia TaxID=5888 RepID=A0DXQ6_PARTE|nr:uncharacterized protein GSPATT00021447001 [Paramecium tetraurelia]CAK87823.1 unnamed protein product [Paramecium tetraurelia]|eukprot:XP_001455220.1 hypothetical protein (macronuclear) [Paramecium tetraurelia strain d4-2]
MQQLSKELNALISKAIQFNTKLDPFTTNELFLKWRSISNGEIDNINQFINIGIDIVKLQNRYSRNIKKSYSLLNEYIQKYSKDLQNQTCGNYLSLARSTHLNDQLSLQLIYNQIKVDSGVEFSVLKYCADLQCNDMELVSQLIDNLHYKVDAQLLNQYLYCLFVLFPHDQSSLLINLIKDKNVSEITPSNFLLMSELYQNKNIPIPESWKIGGQDSILQKNKQSHLQKEVQLLLNVVNLSYEQEKLIDDLYQIDFFLPQYNQILEVNGPQHYVFDIEQNNSKIFTGKHYYKQMCLSALGYDVRNLCFLDFYKARGVTAKLIYLKSILE